MSQTYKTEGIILKRINFKEADRIITLFTPDYGKLTVLAKGVRKPTSKKSGSLETGSTAVFFMVKGRSLDILTQTQLIHSFSTHHLDLVKVTQLNQILEIIDALTVENQENPAVYQLLKDYLALLNQGEAAKTKLLETIRLILKEMGFTHDKQFTEGELKEYLEEIIQRELRSKPFLTPQRLKLND